MKLIILFLISIILSSINPTVVVNGLSCELCEFSVKAAEDLINQNVTNNQIIPYLESACTYLPNQWINSCQLIIEQYGTSIIKLVLENENPLTVCTQLGLCGEFQKLISEQYEIDNNKMLSKWHWHHHHGHGINPLKKLECKACYFAVGKAELVVNKDFNTGKKYVDDECNHFEIKEAIHFCKSIVNKEMSTIFNELKRHESKENICKHIHMC